LNATVYAGVGGGIVVTGLICMTVARLHLHSIDAWNILGLTAVGLCAMAWRSFASGNAGDARNNTEGTAGSKPAWHGQQTRLVIAYGCFGFGYIMPATFLPAIAKQLVSDPLLFQWSWPMFGLAAAVSTYALAFAARSIDLRRAWIFAQFTMAMGVVLPLVWSGAVGVIISALAVGGTFMVITAAAMQEARRVAPDRTVGLMSAMTASFATGQIMGPVAVGVLAGAAQNFAAPLALGCAFLIGGALLIVRRHESAPHSLCKTEDAR
jgi:predicted MFS family arabinose efflux permease